jgi:bifunctional DNA-binding transcriptional regulator/antitoxin component of YhaV-PrlF toxin-antitoxin module
MGSKKKRHRKRKAEPTPILDIGALLEPVNTTDLEITYDTEADSNVIQPSHQAEFRHVFESFKTLKTEDIESKKEDTVEEEAEEKITLSKKKRKLAS